MLANSKYDLVSYVCIPPA